MSATPPIADQIVYKAAGIAETFGIDWRPFIVRPWGPEKQYATGAIVRAPVGNGFYHIATSLGPGLGLSSRLVPDFGTTDGEIVNDGSLTWTARYPGAVVLPTITLSTWSLDAGVIEDATAINQLIASITVSGGIAGEQYRLINRITKSDGDSEEDSIVLQILDPADV